MDPQTTAPPTTEPARDITGGRAREPDREEIVRWKLAEEAQMARRDFTFWCHAVVDAIDARWPIPAPVVYRGAILSRRNLPHPTGLNRATRRARGL